jgi:hypothetical protein
MQGWMLNRITDYWDQQVDAIERLSEVLADASDAERPAQIDAIDAAITRHVRALDDKLLQQSAIPIVEDLYKSIIELSRLDSPLLSYLEATGVPYFRELSRRGYSVNYFIDNSYNSFGGPVVALPAWFGAAGLAYVCPQAIAIADFEKNRPESEWPSLAAKYTASARDVAGELVDRLRQAGRSFAYLDTDAPEGAFAAAERTRGKTGVIHIIRVEAPTPGSKCLVTFPPGPSGAAAAGSPPSEAKPGAFGALKSFFSQRKN